MSGVGTLKRWGWVVGLVVGLVVGICAAAGLWQAAQSRADRDAAAYREAVAKEGFDVPGVPEPGELTRELIDGTRDAHLHVDASLRDRVSEEEMARVERLLAASPVPAHIAYMPQPDSGRHGYNDSSLAAMWMAGVGVDGHYAVLWSDGFHESVARGMEDHYFDVRPGGQPGPTLQRMATEMAAWDMEPEHDRVAVRDAQEDYWGGWWGGFFAGLLACLFIVLPLHGALWAVVANARRPR